MSTNCDAHPDHKDELKRLNRLAGQVEGVKKMINEKRYCVDIITQLRAIQSAAKAVEAGILKKHINSCVKEAFNSKVKNDSEEKVNELIELFKKL